MPRKATSHDKMKLGQVIREAIERCPLDVSMICERAGIHRTHLYHVMSGNKSFGKEKIITLAHVLNRRPSEFLALAGYDSDAQNISVDALVSLSLSGLRNKRIRVITDPRFADSALFLWILDRQPLRADGIEFEILWDTYWQDVPEKVADEESMDVYSIGFANRRPKERWEEREIFNVNYWADLAIYRGYALLAREKDILAAGYSSSQIMERASEFIEKLVSSSKQCEIVTMAEDTVWRLCLEEPRYNKLRSALNNLGLSNEYPFLNRNNVKSPTIRRDANAALRQFCDGTGSFFVGGLPQRLAGVREGLIEVISFENNRSLFSINSLICSEPTFQEATVLLGTVEALWFQTMRRLYISPSVDGSRSDTTPRLMENDIVEEWVRDNVNNLPTNLDPESLIERLNLVKGVAQSVLAFLRNTNVTAHHIDEQLYLDLFFNYRGKYEVFPGSPLELLDTYTRIIGDISRTSLDSSIFDLISSALYRTDEV